MIGRRLGRYCITGKLGQGGMASVWRADDGLLGRAVAVKVLSDALADSPEARRRFLHEARTALLLDHPGIAAVYDAGETAGAVWMAMALVDGETLGERIARSLPTIEEAVRIVCAAGAALSHAHSRGVVHRDVTPRNIMVGRDGRVFVLDFGLALVQGQSRVTTSDTTLGTVCYLSPEVVAGHTADPRSDLYGLGVVLYETLTGALPFPGDRPEAVLYGIVNEEPVPARARRPEIPEALERTVLRAMARRPEDRPGSAEDLVAELQPFGTAGTAAPPGARPMEIVPCYGAVEPGPAPLGRGGPVYLAVLPFEDVGSPDDPAGGRQALAGGLAEAVAAALGGAPNLRVIPPTPETARAGADETLQGLASRLGANLLLRGTVRQAGMQVRVAWSLIDPRQGAQNAGDTLDGSAMEWFDLEDRLIADLRRALGQPGAALAEASRPRPRDPAAHERYLQARGYLQRYDNEASVDGAISLLERLLAGESDSARVHATLGRACLLKHRLTSQRAWAERAANECERALELDADDPEVLVTRGDLRASVGQLEEAIADYRHALELRPDLPEALLGLARASVDAGDLPAAEQAARRAIALRQRDWRGYSMLGFVYYQEGQYARAVEPWRRAVRLAPDNARALRNLGTAYHQLDRVEDAVVAYRRSLAVKPDAVTYRNLGTALFVLRRYDDAAESFEKATALAPSDAIAWGNLGSAWHYLPGHRQEAAAVLERAVAMMRERLRRNPRDGDGWLRLASWLANLERASEAREALATGAGLAAGNASMLADAGETYCQLGDRDRALECLREAVRLGYRTSLLMRMLELERLRDDPEFRRILEQGTAIRPVRSGPGRRQGGDA